MSKIPPLLRRPIVIVVLGVVVLAAVVTFAVVGRRAQNPLLATPELALQAVSGHSVYYNSSALPWILSKRPELLTDEDRAANSARVRGFVQAVQNPKLFRQLDRQYRFDTLFLVGDPSQYRPLLEHLLESKDWVLGYLDHTSLIFRRDAPHPWSESDFASVRKAFEGANAADRAHFLAGAANKLTATRQTTLAGKLLDEAQELDGGLPDVWSGKAQRRLALGQWKEANADADRALALDEDWAPAMACKAQALYATKHFADAYPFSRKLIEKSPDDPGLLFYHAKIAHEARAYTDEIRTMNHLIELAVRENRPTSGYRVYLAQAYAADGQAESSVEQFRLAMQDPELPADQRKFAEDTITQIKSRTGMR